MQKEPSFQSAQLDQLLQEISTKTNQKYKMFMENDPKLQRQDTVKGILHLLQQYKSLLAKSSELSAQQKANNYHIIYNTVSYMCQISDTIKKSNFSYEAIKPLVQCIISLESNLILTDAKYLDKRTQIYLNICKIYQQGQYYQPAILLLEGAIKKYQQLRVIYQLDPPVPSHISLILTNNICLLKILQIKFNIQGGVLNANDWKKKVDQQFKDNLQFKIICLIECLRTQTKKHSNIFQKNTKPFKQVLVQQGYDLIKPFSQTISKSLKQQKEKIQFQVTFKQKTISQSFSQEQINEQLKKKRELISKSSVKQSQFKKASQAFPLQYQAQLIYYSYQVKNMKVLNELIASAMIRVQCRRIEVPYLNDIAIIASNSQNPNIPNGYQKYPIDLNDANLREQLKKLRKSGKTNPEGVTTISNQPNKQVPQKDAKKGGKQKEVPKIQEKPKQTDQPSQWQLSQINHKYVFMTYRKSMNPQNALYDMSIVLGHEQKGPVGYQDCRRIVVPYVQQNQNVISSSIQQYKGVKQSTQKIPYIILYHSRNSLENQQQKKNVIVDVVPIIGKNPMIPAKLGYKKIQLDLRQVPSEFIKSKDHTYIYLSYKTDYQFCISSRLIQLFSSFIQLQNTFGQSKQGLSIAESQKNEQLQIKYDIQKLQNFFTVFQQTLKGSLGQQFYLQKNDFLTHLVSYIWKKYLRGALTQFQYVMDQRLNQQIIDSDYKNYKQIIDKCKPIFLKGLKVLNLIMINNPKCDILLLSKISLQLIKLLQQSRDYYLASENARLALDRIRIFRDQYLTKSVFGLQDYPLPFSLTSSNVKLGQTFAQMKQKYISQRLQIEKINRIRQRQKQGKKPFSQQELLQEQLQYKSNRKNDQFDQAIQNFKNKHLEINSIVAAIDLDMTNLYFRVALKHGQQLKKRGVKQGQTLQTQQFQGLASTLLQKLGFLQTKSNKKQAKNLKQLQTTLIKADKLAPQKPQTSRPERKLLLQCQKNPYTFSLLLMNLAALNSGNQDKKYYLNQSLKMINQCQQTQKRLLENCIENSIFIYSSLFDSQINSNEQNSSWIKPFADLYNGVWPCQSQVPLSPILMGKNSQTVYMKLPPFISKNKGSRRLNDMKLFGKISANGVDVSTNCDQLIGTGTKAGFGSIIKVSHLKANNNYCFAVAPINESDQLMQIGKTSFDIPTHNTLSISMIACYLAKISYQIGEHQIAQEAAKIVIKQFVSESNYFNPKTQSTNTIFRYSLNQEKLQQVSLLQIKAIAQCLYISGLCERKKLQKIKLLGNKISIQQKQNQIANLMLLAGVLQPVLSAPISNLLFSIPNQENTVLIKAFVLSLMQTEYLSPKLRKQGTLIMQKVMKWGLQNNQIALARRILYKWTQRKWINIGKMTQIQEKKQGKKGGKDPKEAQDVKLIDKYCHFALQKSPQIIQQFQDSLVTVSQQYSDFLSLFIQRVKQQINQFSQYADNEPQKVQEMLNNLNLKLDLNQSIKDPINSIKKFGTNSKLYLEYNCKIIRRALQMSSKTEYKALNDKIKDLQNGDLTPEVTESLQILSLMINAVQNDIQWSPESKETVKLIMEKTGKDLSKQIQIYTKYEQKMTHLTTQLAQKSFSFLKKYQDYDYIHLWLSQLHHLKAVSSLSALQVQASENQKIFKVQYKIKPIYTNLSFLKLQDLKKQFKQVEVIGKQKCQFQKSTIQRIEKFLKQISQAMYSAYCIQNWQKLSNLLMLLQNFINYYQITPFNHFNSKVWIWLGSISIIGVQMLKTIKKRGINTYKTRYQKKIINTQLQSVSCVLNPTEKCNFQELYNPFVAVYYLPQLSATTTKQPWFLSYKDLQISTITNIITYTVQCLYLSQKNNLIINILRQYCNVTQNTFSLQFLPFMIDCQQKLADQVGKAIAQKQQELNLVVKQYEKQKMGKKKRQAQITGQKMKYQIQYEEKSTKINQSLRLLNEENHFIINQREASKIVIRQIQRDCNKASLNQKQQKKYLIQFGEDQQNIFKAYRAPSTNLSNYQKDHIVESKDGKQKQSLSMNRNKLNILSKNRNNILKDLISKYQSIYQQLRNNKTSKDPLAQIINRNDVGNLYFALNTTKNTSNSNQSNASDKRRSSGQINSNKNLNQQKNARFENIQKSFQYWNDALATIFRKVNPLDNYLEVINQNKKILVQNIGFKELLIALNIIYKISNFTCDKTLSLIRNCIILSSFIVFEFFKTSLIHPQCLLQFQSYRLKSFQQYECQFLHESVNMNQLVQGLQNLVWKGLDYLDQSELIKLAPVVCLYEYLAIDVVKNTRVAIKSKMLKSIVLALCGCVKQSSICLMFVSYQKDLPILWLEKTDNLKKQKGQNWFPGAQNPLFNQSKTFFATQNKEPIQSIKKLAYPVSFKKELQPQLEIIFSFSKSLLLSKIYAQELTLQNFEQNQDRIINLKQIQNGLRENLKRVSTEQEFYRLWEELQDAKLSFANNQIDQNQIKKKQTQITSYLKSNAYEQVYINKVIQRKSSPSNSTMKRIFLIQLMARMRFSVHRVNSMRKMYINSFYVLKNGLKNFNRYCYRARKVQTGYDPQISQVAPQQQVGKKQDKKGGKKQQQVQKPVVSQIDPVVQERIKAQSQKLMKRFCPSAFWHIKLTYEIGFILYQQNNFIPALAVFQELAIYCQRYGQTYFKAYGFTYSERCKVRLGNFRKQKILQLIGILQNSNFYDYKFVAFAMDAGEMFQDQIREELFKKGLSQCKRLWQLVGMKKYIVGIGLPAPQKFYGYSDQLTAQQEQLVRKKQKKQEKKGGKQQKKAPKKDDGKKKKEQIKSQFKIYPLSQSKQTNLQEDEQSLTSTQFKKYSLQNHPNFYQVNIYNDLAKKYIKCWLRLSKCLNNSFEENKLGFFSQVSKLISISQKYPENSCQKLFLLRAEGQFNKNTFLAKFQNYLDQLKKAQFNQLKVPYQDLPRNQRLNNLPSHALFLNKNLKYLQKASDCYKQLLNLVQKTPLILQNDQSLDAIPFEYSFISSLQIQFTGMLIPKYLKLSEENDIITSKKQINRKLMGRLVKLLKYSIEISIAQRYLIQEYYQIAKKQLQANVKIDQDILVELKNMDKQCKNFYPQHLKQSVKPKQNINSIDLLTYLLKLKRQSQVMTFGNPLQSNLNKCYRILSASLPSFKQKCVVNFPNFDKIQYENDENMLIVRSRRQFQRLNGKQSQTDVYLYVIGKQRVQAANYINQPYYGKINIKIDDVSALLQQCHKIQSKLKQSAILSQAVKNRNFLQCQKPFGSIIQQLSKKFNPKLTYEILQSSQNKPPKLSEQNVSTLIKLLSGQLFKSDGGQFSHFLRVLHKWKYNLIDVKKLEKQK